MDLDEWVISWRPFSPDGLFVCRLGDLNKNENIIIPKYGINNALRFNSLAEAKLLIRSIAELDGHSYFKDWLIVNLKDHE